jgi:4-hydroxy-tetrahydrodipicolinate reductase
MGRLIGQMAPNYGFEVALHLDGKENAGARAITPEAFRDIRVAIEFSTPEAAPANLHGLSELRVPVVTGTTGWLSHLESVKQSVLAHNTALVWSANFSIGVAVFTRVVATTARLLRNHPGYGAWAWEIHHDAKKDAPSGTLVKLVKAMKEAGYDRYIDTSSNRSGRHPGTHEIGFDSASDTITLRHTARSRDGFAEGALKAAQWILDRRGVFTFEDVLFGESKRDEA